VRLLAAALLATTALCQPALAQVGLPWPGPGTVASGGGGGYAGPGDVLSGAFAWYGLRAYSAAAAASNLKAVRVQSASHGGEECDVLLATNGGLGVTANPSGGSCTDTGLSLATFCNSNTDCGVATWYDQSGNARDAPHGGSSFYALLSISPLFAKCGTTAGNGNQNTYYESASAALSQPLTTSFVSQRTNVSGSRSGIMSGNSLSNGYDTGSQQLALYAGSRVNITTAASEGAQLAVQGTNDGANSVIYDNSQNNTGLNPGSSTTTGALLLCEGGQGGSDQASLVKVWEFGFWQGTAANHTNFPYASMESNQRGSNGWNF
jgi:hypothetical protein